MLKKKLLNIKEAESVQSENLPSPQVQSHGNLWMAPGLKWNSGKGQEAMT